MHTALPAQWEEKAVVASQADVLIAVPEMAGTGKALAVKSRSATEVNTSNLDDNASVTTASGELAETSETEGHWDEPVLFEESQCEPKTSETRMASKPTCPVMGDADGTLPLSEPAIVQSVSAEVSIFAQMEQTFSERLMKTSVLEPLQKQVVGLASNPSMQKAGLAAAAIICFSLLRSLRA